MRRWDNARSKNDLALARHAWIEMRVWLRRLVLACVIAVVFVPHSVNAQTHPQCPPAPKLEGSTISVGTKAAVDAVSKLLAKVGMDVDVRATRESVLKDNPRADQVIVVLTLANTMCEMIWSDTTLSGGDKAIRYQSVMQAIFAPVLGPVPVARTDGRKSRREWKNDLIVLASADTAAAPLFAQGEGGVKLPEPQTGFLRDAPFYVNEFNKYFVIVGSAPTREEGLRLMERLKKKAPQHDFVLYAPYGENSYYGVMMATWVPRDVATEAMKLARRDVAPDAFLWACRSSGDSC